MSFTVLIDWKFVVALGAVVIGTVLTCKLDSNAAERVSIHVVDACRDNAIAGNGNC